MKYLTQLLFTIEKNLKVVFRNYVLIFLLIVGPLLLIILIGFTFGGDELHDITAGVVNPERVAIGELIENLQEVNIVTYNSQQSCVMAMEQGTVHLCIVIEQKERAYILILYDNSRYNLVKILLEYLKEQVGYTSEQITLATTESILENVSTIVFFMSHSLDEIDLLKTQLISMQGELNRLHEQLIEIQTSFEPSYTHIKDIEPYINDTGISYHQDKETIVKSMTKLLKLINLTSEELHAFNKILENNSYFNDSYFNNSYFNISVGEHLANNISNLEIQLHYLEEKINDFQYVLETTEMNTIQVSLQTREIIIELDRIHELLNTSIGLIEYQMIFISSSLETLDKTSKQLEENLATFSGFNRSAAESIVNPFTVAYHSLLPETEQIRIFFPTLLMIILMFISIIFSNIIVLNEINSPAYARSQVLPVSSVIVSLGLFFTNLLLVLLQIFVLLFIAQLRFSLLVGVSYFSLIFGILLLSSVFILLGMVIAFFVREKQTSILTSVFTSLGLLLFSHVLFPLEGMNPWAAFFAQYNPLVIGEHFLRKTMLFGIQNVYSEIYILLIFLIIFIILLGSIRK